MQYKIEDNLSGDHTWTGSVVGDELTMHNQSRTLSFPGCLQNCNRTSHPIDEAAYAALFPLRVGNTATYTRQRVDGARHWERRARVTGQRTVNTPVGRLSVFVVETDIRGIRGFDF